MHTYTARPRHVSCHLITSDDMALDVKVPCKQHHQVDAVAKDLLPLDLGERGGLRGHGVLKILVAIELQARPTVSESKLICCEDMLRVLATLREGHKLRALRGSGDPGPDAWPLDGVLADVGYARASCACLQGHQLLISFITTLTFWRQERLYLIERPSMNPPFAC